MTACARNQRKLVEYLSGGLDPVEREATMTHLKDCPSCRAEEARWMKLLEAAAAGKRDTDRATAGIDWEGLAQRIADAAEQNIAGRRAQPEHRRRHPAWLVRPAMAYLLVGLFIGGLAMWAVFKAGVFSPRPRTGYFASTEFLDKAETELARRETVEYLVRSQYLLLDFSQAPANQAGAVLSAEIASGKAADLLSRKKFINSQLDKVPMAKAREICDQIEVLCLELSQIGGRLDEAQWREIQDRVRQSQLLLQINLVKKELQSREI
jgi:hypothetical protein